MFNHSHTVLLITRQVLARIDLSGRKRLSVKQIWTSPGCDYDNILTEVSKAIKLGHRSPGRVTIVSPDFWTDILSIPTDVVSIASEREINQALALEAEVDSGLSAFDSRTGAIRVSKEEERSEECRWCVSQVPLRQLREFESALQPFGARLHCIAHPIAPQLFLSEQISIECLQGSLDSWRGQVSLNTDEIQTFAKSWASLLQAPNHPLLMQVEREPVNSKSQSVAITASLALLTAGGCGLWHWQTKKSLAATLQSIEQIEKQQSQREASEAALKNAEASIIHLRQEVSKTQAERLAAERRIQLAGVVHQLHNHRWLALVDALAESASETCWVQKLESNSTQTVVHGLAIDNAAANSFAGRLEMALKGSGWRTAPAATSLSTHNLIAFKIVLKAKLKHDEESITGIAHEQGLIATPIELAGGVKP